MPKRKRLFDILCATCALIVLLPVLAAIALLIRLASRGPVIFKQRRMGFGGKPFTIYKFRTLKHKAECRRVLDYVGDDDPRLAPFGSLLRATRLDELPQLWNVLAGTMSIVGPRPHSLWDAEYLAWELPEYSRRHALVPGITSTAKIRVPDRPAIGRYKEELVFDLAYAESLKHYSPARDLAIIFATLPIILKGKGVKALYA